MDKVIIGLILAISVLLVLVVLAQNSKGGGLSGTFGGSGAQVMGAKRTTDFLEKLTWGLAAGMLVLSLLTNVVIKDNGGQGFKSSNFDAAKDKTVITPGATEAPEFESEGVTQDPAEASESVVSPAETTEGIETTEEATQE